jgi:hypothetical protein
MFSDGDIFLETKQNSELTSYRNKATEMNVGVRFQNRFFFFAVVTPYPHLFWRSFTLYEYVVHVAYQEYIYNR